MTDSWAGDHGKPNPKWAANGRDLELLATIITNVVKKHFPDSEIYHFIVEDYDQHITMDGVRFYPPHEPSTPTAPAFMTAAFSVKPELYALSAYEKELGHIPEAEERRQAMMNDIWKIFVGFDADCIPEKTAPGGDPYEQLNRPIVGMSTIPGETAGSIRIYGDPKELVQKMRENIRYNPEVAHFVPKESRER